MCATVLGQIIHHHRILSKSSNFVRGELEFFLKTLTYRTFFFRENFWPDSNSPMCFLKKVVFFKRQNMGFFRLDVIFRYFFFEKIAAFDQKWSKKTPKFIFWQVQNISCPKIRFHHFSSIFHVFRPFLRKSCFVDGTIFFLKKKSIYSVKEKYMLIWQKTLKI